MKNLLVITFAVAALLCGGCSSLYKSTVTFTEIVDKSMSAWAKLSVAGQTTPAIDKTVTAAHDRYRQAAAVARDALITYKANGDKKAYERALLTVKTSVFGLLDAVTPLLTIDKANELRRATAKASTL